MTKLTSFGKNILPVSLFFLSFLAIWQAIVSMGQLPEILLPSPSQVGRVFLENSGKFASATIFTAEAAMTGLATSLVVGVFTAIIFSQSTFVRKGLYPYAVLLQTVPIVAIAPIIITWIGEGFWAVAMIAFLISLFPIITNTTQGILSTSSSLLDLFQLNSATRIQRLWKLQLPHALPGLLTGVRVSSGLAVLGAIVGEFFAGYSTQQMGLGYWIYHTKDNSRAEMYAFVLTSTLLGVVIFTAVGYIGKKMLYWCESEFSSTTR